MNARVTRSVAMAAGQSPTTRTAEDFTANLAAGVVPEASGGAAGAVPADRRAGNVRAIRQTGA